MDSSAFRNMDLRGLFWFAVFGFVCACLLGAGAAIAAVWFLVVHVQIV